MTTTIKKGYKYRIYPTLEQQVFLEKTFGCCRKVWNVLLAQVNEEYSNWKLNPSLPKPRVSAYDFQNALPLLKERQEYSYLKEVSSKALQIQSHKLGEAFTKFFKSKGKIGYPQFKSKHKSRDSFTLESYVNGANYFKVKNNIFTIAKLSEPIKISWCRELPSESTQVTISKNAAGQYFASFLCDTTSQLTNGQGIVGVDLGIKTLATQSNGIAISNPKYFVTSQKKLACLQRRLSKKCKGSKNRDKARLKVARLHLKISNQRQDYIHKLTRSLVNDNQVIVIEDLNVKGMSQNRKLSKHILDAGLGMFRRYLEYKTIESSWCRVIVADRFYPSTQLCSVCGSRPIPKIKLGVSQWTCASCNTLHGRDDNASINLSHIATKRPELWIDHPGKIILTKAYEELVG